MSVVTSKKGIVLALSAFFMWSCFPFYFKMLAQYHAIEIIAHRIIWTFVLLCGLLLAFKHGDGLGILKKQPKWILYTFVSGALIGLNWLTYVWAVNHDKLLEASLGYFISPLAGVGLSFFVLKEPLSALQKLAVLFALAGIVLQLVMLGNIPLVSLLLGFTFSVYGLMHRRTPIDSLTALFVETAILLPFCVLWLFWHDVASSRLSFWWSSDIWLLMLAGPITLVPLFLYNSATKQVHFNTLSFLNYITPSMIFLIAIFYYKEQFDWAKLAVFVLIWVGLFLFSVDLLRKKRIH